MPPESSNGCVAILRSGQECGIPGIGRCTQCEHAYCAGHLDTTGLRPVICGRCYAEQQQDLVRSAHDLRSQLTSDLDRFRALFVQFRREVGVRGQVEREIRIGEKRVPFRGYAPTYEQLPPAWPIGKVTWLAVYTTKDGTSEYRESVETGITSTGELVPMQPPSSYGTQGNSIKYLDPNPSMAYQGLVRLARDTGVTLPPA